MILECKDLITGYTNNIKEAVGNLKSKPKLALIRVEGDDASKVYVGLKEKKCKEVGILSETIVLENNVTTEELVEGIKELNRERDVHGILVQLPLPSHIDEDVVLNTIAPYKDVDGLTLLNVGGLQIGADINLMPCTPKGIMALLSYSGITLSGKKVLIINRSNIVGKPLAAMMMNANATVTIAHSKTHPNDLEMLMKTADIIVTGVGKIDFIDKDYVPFKKQIIIDVSINRDANGKLCGDVNKELYNHEKLLITPVPGSVGPMTVLTLLNNTYIAYMNANSKN